MVPGYILEDRKTEIVNIIVTDTGNHRSLGPPLYLNCQVVNMVCLCITNLEPPHDICLCVRTLELTHDEFDDVPASGLSPSFQKTTSNIAISHRS